MGTARALWGVQGLAIQASVCQAVPGYIHTVRHIVSRDHLTVLASQSSNQGSFMDIVELLPSLQA